MDINKDNISEEKIQETFTQIIGISNKKKQIHLKERSRYLNSIFIGKAGTGKTTQILPSLVSQDIKNKNCGATIIVDNEDVAFQLFAIAKNFKRRVYFINPYMDVPFLYDFLNLEEYDYDFINEKVIDYKKAIREKSIVIINMNSTKYSDFAIKIVSMMLNQLQIDMTYTSETKKTPHFLYVDNFNMYIKSVVPLLVNGKEFNIGTTLFANSLYESKGYFNILESNIRNTFILNSICEVDIEYFKKKLYELNISKFYYGKKMEFLYEIIADDSRKNGEGVINSIEDELIIDINEKAIRFKKRAYKKIEKLKNKTERMKNIKKKTTSKVNNITIEEKSELVDVKLEPFIENGFGVEDNEPPIKLENQDDNKKYDNQTLFFNEDTEESNDNNEVNKSIINQINIIDELPKQIKKKELKKEEKKEKKEYISLSDIDFDDTY